MAGIAMIRQDRPHVAVELQGPAANKILSHGVMEATIRQEGEGEHSRDDGTFHWRGNDLMKGKIKQSHQFESKGGIFIS
jgi:hypothetical protein